MMTAGMSSHSGEKGEQGCFTEPSTKEFSLEGKTIQLHPHKPAESMDRSVKSDGFCNNSTNTQNSSFNKGL